MLRKVLTQVLYNRIYRANQGNLAEPCQDPRPWEYRRVHLRGHLQWSWPRVWGPQDSLCSRKTKWAGEVRDPDQDPALPRGLDAGLWPRHRGLQAQEAGDPGPVSGSHWPDVWAVDRVVFLRDHLRTGVALMLFGCYYVSIKFDKGDTPASCYKGAQL